MSGIGTVQTWLAFAFMAGVPVVVVVLRWWQR